jgi:hypothetical protein
MEEKTNNLSFFQMIRIWPRKSHDVQTSSKRRIEDHDVTGSPGTSSQSSRANRYTKGGSLDSRYSGDTAKSYPHLVRNVKSFGFIRSFYGTNEISLCNFINVMQ